MTLIEYVLDNVMEPVDDSPTPSVTFCRLGGPRNATTASPGQ